MVEYIRYVRLVSIILFFFYMRKYVMEGAYDRYLLVKKEMMDRLSLAMNKNTGKNIFSYSYQKKRLDAYGVTYYSKGRITPLNYLMYKIVAMAAVFVAGMSKGLPAAILLMIVVWIIPEWYIKERNRRDNEKMLGSLMAVYDVILLQINSGEYITQILVDAYRVAAHPRLKAQLICLTGDIMCTNDLALSMELFAGKFANENIDNLVILVRQLMDTGTTSRMIGDIRKNLSFLQKSYNEYERQKVARQGNACAIAMFIVIMGMIAYLSMVSLSDAAKLLI